MPWSIFTDGGGDGAAVTWAQDLEKILGVPTTPANTQFIYDWEKAEGGGGKYNPLNQGPVPNHPELTSTGQQYGGGAADFVSWQAGLQGAAAYINMPAYSGIKQALQQSNYGAAKSALVASPWAASHYNGGANFPNTPPPGAAQLAPGGGDVTASGGSGSPGFNFLNPATWLPAIEKPLADILERGALIVFGAMLIIVGLIRFTAAGNRIRDNMQKPVTTGKPEGKGSLVSEAETEAEAAPEAAVAA
jgi:hypothetical protein